MSYHDGNVSALLGCIRDRLRFMEISSALRATTGKSAEIERGDDRCMRICGCEQRRMRICGCATMMDWWAGGKATRTRHWKQSWMRICGRVRAPAIASAEWDASWRRRWRHWHAYTRSHPLTDLTTVLSHVTCARLADSSKCAKRGTFRRVFDQRVFVGNPPLSRAPIAWVEPTHLLLVVITHRSHDKRCASFHQLLSSAFMHVKGSQIRNQIDLDIFVLTDRPIISRDPGAFIELLDQLIRRNHKAVSSRARRSRREPGAFPG